MAAAAVASAAVHPCDPLGLVLAQASALALTRVWTHGGAPPEGLFETVLDSIAEILMEHGDQEDQARRTALVTVGGTGCAIRGYHKFVRDLAARIARGQVPSPTTSDEILALGIDQMIWYHTAESGPE